MKKQILLIVYIISAVLSGCVDTKQAEIEIIEARIDNESILILSDIIDKVEFIRLETSEEFLLSAIYKTIIHNNKIFILDRSTKQVLCFDMEGNGVYKIHSLGQGPSEYVSLYDININATDKTLELLDAMKSRIMKYNYNGKLIESVKLPVETFNFITNSLGKYLLYNPYINRSGLKEYQYLLFSSNLTDTLFTGIIPSCDNCDRLTTPFPFSQSGEMITFYSGYRDTIYEFRKEKVKKYKVDFGSGAIPMKDLAWILRV